MSRSEMLLWTCGIYGAVFVLAIVNATLPGAGIPASESEGGEASRP